jgi:hypothetical protein
VDDKVTVVAQDPFTLVVSFDTIGQVADFFQFEMNGVCDGLILTGIGAGAYNEIIREGCDAGEVEDCNVFSLFGLRGSYGEQPAGPIWSFFGFDLGDGAYFFLGQKRPPTRYRTIRVVVYLRFAAVAAVSLSLLFAQSEAIPGSALAPATASAPSLVDERTFANPLQPDENDQGVVRARQEVEQIRKLVGMGALPALRLKKAQDEVQDALDMSLLKQNIYSNQLLPEQMDQMIYIAQKMVVRRQRAMDEMQELVNAGVISRTEAQLTTADLGRAQAEMALAEARAKLIQQVAESVRLERNIASIETQAQTHPEWAGKVFVKYDGNGVFKPSDLRAVEGAFAGKFARSLPISADGETAVHRALGFDHRGRVDVAVSPDQPEGQWLMHYLESRHIPYFAFRMAVPGKATGAHIHLGPESTRLGS